MTSSNAPDPPADEAIHAPTIASNAAPLRDERPHPHHRRRRIFAGSAVTLALLAHVRAQAGGADLLNIAQSQSIPAGWRRYREPDGYFTVAIPDGWTAARDTGSGTMGDRTGSDAFTTTDIALGGPPRGWQTITVYFTIEPITDAFERHWYCQPGASPGVNAKVAGLPAFYDPVFGWLLDTSGAHFQIGYTYPGDRGDILMTNAPTPIPQAELTQGQQEMATILASFRPNPATPLHCP